MSDYDPKQIEPKWQKEWEKSRVYRAEDNSSKPKYYALIEFPYPSGDGLHVGHPRPYIGMDVIARKKRMEGKNVLYPIGWDAFGLPTENYAIKTGRPPAEITKENTDTFRRQIQSIGISFDWSREINTTDPKYYKWTQWLFLKFLEHGLAYKAKMPINWCPKDKIGLANEEVVDGKCERCGTPVEQREKEQWMLAITKYADKLLNDLDTVDYPERVKTQQKNWIGKSEGAEIEFGIKNQESRIKVFTTRPDTIFGATFLVKAGKEDRFTGEYTINPATTQEIPVWEAEYVYSDYGTGAIMGVPAHDERDFEFAKKHDLPIVNVIQPYPGSPRVGGIYSINQGPNITEEIDKTTKKILAAELCWIGEGTLRNSGKFNSLTTEEARNKITEKFGKKITKYKLRDWVFSRQRYWGEPIPVVHCGKCGIVPVAEKDLPVLLPDMKNYMPTDTGESPLANVKEFVDTECQQCGGKAKRETDTMPNWAGSSWYFLAYLFDKKGFENSTSIENWKLQIENFAHWMPVDWYNGGMEHTVLHLLYSRFWNKFLHDIGLVPVSEPYNKRTSHGLILAEGGEKMSKSKGNVINPDSIVERFGADTLRLYEMFMGPFEQAIAWSESSLVGPRRFLEKVWKSQAKVCQGNSLNIDSQGVSLAHQTIKKVSEDIEHMRFNTAISTMMIFANDLEKKEKISKEEYETLLKLLAPFAPHMTEELWHLLGYNDSIHKESWPQYDETKLVSEVVTIVVQVNGRVRDKFKAPSGLKEAEAFELASKLPEVQKWVGNKPVQNRIYVANKLVNFVTS